MGLSIVTPPNEWPLSTDDAKTHLRVRHAEEDGYITDLVKAATTYLEGQFDLVLARKQFKLTLDAFTDTIELPRKPVSSVDAVKYFDTNGQEQTADVALYSSDLESRTGWVVRNSDQAWPEILSGVNMVSVVFTAGYTVLTVPDDAKQAIRMLIGHWYANRETISVGLMASPLPFGVKAIIDSFMVPLG